MPNLQKTYSVVVAGMGKRGTHHAEAVAKNQRFKLVGLCDIDQGRLDAAGTFSKGTLTRSECLFFV